MEVRFAWLMRTLARLVVLGCVLGGLPWVVSEARAQDKNVEARTTFERGVEASRGQHWDEARVQFERSLSLVPKPSTMFNLALAYLKLGLGRRALEQLDAFEAASSPDEHAAMLSRAQVLRPQAQALVDSEKAKAQSGGNVLSASEAGLSDEVQKEVAEARANYQRGRDKQALSGFERAYKKSQRPELLYNIGVVADRLRNDRRAISAYDAFVAALPDAREAAVAQVRSESLRVALEREQSEPEARRTDEAREPNLRGPRALLVTGALLTVASVVTLAVSISKLSEYNNCIDIQDRFDRAMTGQFCKNADQVRDSRPLAIGGVAASSVVVATGIVLTIVGGVQLAERKHDKQRYAWAPALTWGSERAASLTFAGRF